MAGLKLRKIDKNFGMVQVIKGLDLDIEHGEFVVFVGPSGCGKSTLLRMIAGLELPDQLHPRPTSTAAPGSTVSRRPPGTGPGLNLFVPLGLEGTL